jgi:uncharacterized protein GlcG (DUF336 family)
MEMEEIKLSAVKVALEAAEQKAITIGSPSSIAVLDSGRELVGFIRMDGALLASAEISQAKAYTSRSMNAPTSALGELVQPGGPLYGIGNAHLKVGRPLITFGGGVPVIIGGAVVGAVGVAGGSPDQDEEIAQAAADALGGA